MSHCEPLSSRRAAFRAVVLPFEPSRGPCCSGPFAPRTPRNASSRLTRQPCVLSRIAGPAGLMGDLVEREGHCSVDDGCEGEEAFSIETKRLKKAKRKAERESRKRDKEMAKSPRQPSPQMTEKDNDIAKIKRRKPDVPAPKTLPVNEGKRGTVQASTERAPSTTGEDDPILALAISLEPPQRQAEPTPAAEKNLEEAGQARDAGKAGGWGMFIPDKKEWVWDVDPEKTRMTIKHMRGRAYVDIRHLYNSMPTKKGVFLPADVFRTILRFPLLEEALAKTKLEIFCRADVCPAEPNFVLDLALDNGPGAQLGRTWPLIMAPLRRVPWYSSAEWLDVCRGVFSEDPYQRDAAVARIALWEVKSPRVPIAVSLTRLLLEALKADNSGNRTVAELQMIYATAIVRFVNQYVDLEQTKAYAQSIAVMGRALGIPSEIIDCRHRITHQDMPSLSLLRHCASLCFDYLQTLYWLPQMEAAQSRLASLSHSKELAARLVAVLHDVRELEPPDDLGSRLRQLLLELRTVMHPQDDKSDDATVARKLEADGQSSSDCSTNCNVKRVLFVAAEVATLKQRDVPRVLKRLGVPEFFSQAAFVSATTWCHSLKTSLSKCVQFLDSTLCQSPHENVTLSFLKDLVLLVFDCEINPAVFLLVVWTLARAGPNLVYRLVTRMIGSIIGAPPPAVKLPKTDPQSSSFGDFKCFSPCGTDEEAPEDQSDDMASFHHESFSLWLKALDVPSDEEERLFTELQGDSGCRSRLISWLRALLLLPSDSDAASSLPTSLEILLRIFCGPITRTLQRKPVLLPLGSRDAFCHKMLACVHLMHARVLAACRANVEVLARTAFRIFFLQPNQEPGGPMGTKTVGSSVGGGSGKFNTMAAAKQQLWCSSSTTEAAGVRQLLKVFEEADVRVSNGGTNCLADWLTRRVLGTTQPNKDDDDDFPPHPHPLSSQQSCGSRPQKLVLRRFLAPLSEDPRGSSQNSLVIDQFKIALGHIIRQALGEPGNPTAAASSATASAAASSSSSSSSSTETHLALDRVRSAVAAAGANAPVRELSTLDIPWTKPGSTVLLRGDNFPGEALKPIVDMMPLHGAGHQLSVPEVLAAFGVDGDLKIPATSRKRLRPEEFDDTMGGQPPPEEDQFVVGPTGKRFRGGEGPDGGPGGFVVGSDGCSVELGVTNEVRVLPSAIQRLEAETIRSQRAQLSGGPWAFQYNHDEEENEWRDGSNITDNWKAFEMILDGD